MQININGKICTANDGESILQVARREGIFIPAICYISGCSPTLACRLCMVEADGKRVYACNAKPKEGMSVLTDTPELDAERNAIMQTYCINHPLQCGVCDKSGECELQNLTALMRVKEQNFSIKSTHKVNKNYGLISYDPALCIVCERCITVCKDKIGESALKTTPRGGDQVAKELKDIVPKDAFAVWSKFQKSLIAPTSGDDLDCSMCGECASACPVGALVDSRFKYTSNAWELKRIPASNPHSSDCELLYYETKPSGIQNRKNKIYRVSNDCEFSELNPSARYAFDFHNENAKKDTQKFQKIVDEIKSGEIKNIKFNSFITNEEALILELLREKYDLNLINSEALRYQEFLDQASKFSGQELYNGDYDDIKKADFIVCAGGFLRNDSPNTSYKVNNAIVMNKASGIYFHSFGDEIVKKWGKAFDTVVHKAGLNDQILLALLSEFAENLPDEVSEFLAKFKYETTENIEKEISEEVVKIVKNEDGEDVESKETIKKKVSEEVVVSKIKFFENIGISKERMGELAKGKANKVLILGEDFYKAKNANILAMLAGLLQKFTDFKLIFIPPRTNSLGVAKICTLSKLAKNGKTLGYNENGDYKFGVFDGDLDAGALNQQEGTFSSINTEVVPTNAALKHEGYFLNDLANALDLTQKYTINYTPKLALKASYKEILFDELENFYDRAGERKRGYKMNNQTSQEQGKFESFELNKEENFNIYLANQASNLSFMSNHSSAFNQALCLYASADFLKQNELSEGDVLSVKKGDFALAMSVKTDKNLSEAIAYMGDYDDKVCVDKIFENSRYAQVVIEKFKGKNDE
ncbi:MAG: NADH-quinone oxidoreductase subunit G [Campylobacter sp.]|nr:NADH-quinone oxidoreductase subunit G [Campylobacter sp.]